MKPAHRSPDYGCGMRARGFYWLHSIFFYYFMFCTFQTCEIGRLKHRVSVLHRTLHERSSPLTFPALWPKIYTQNYFVNINKSNSNSTKWNTSGKPNSFRLSAWYISAKVPTFPVKCKCQQCFRKRSFLLNVNEFFRSNFLFCVICGDLINY